MTTPVRQDDKQKLNGTERSTDWYHQDEGPRLYGTERSTDCCVVGIGLVCRTLMESVPLPDWLSMTSELPAFIDHYKTFIYSHLPFVDFLNLTSTPYNHNIRIACIHRL